MRPILLSESQESVIRTVTPVLEIRDLRKSFGPMTALDGVSFSLSPGERLAFLGPNGAGKTTLIRCLAGRTRPSAGSVKLHGQPIGDPGVRGSLGVVPQEIAIYGDLTTRENLTAFGRFYGLRRGDLRDRVQWALDWTGLQDRADALVTSFSGGMKRRVNLACGVMHAPTVLLLDEPTVGVDPQSRERIFSMLEQLNDGGTSIILTTHQLDEAESQSDRIVIIDQGRVIADGTLPQLVEATVGCSRLVKVRVDRPLAAPLNLKGPRVIRRYAGQQSARVNTIGQRGDRVVASRSEHVASQLPDLLETLRAAGYGVLDVEVQAPSLHHVFMHLTGHELRD